MPPIAVRPPARHAVPPPLHAKFAGQAAKYSQIPFQLTMQDDAAQISGTIPARLSDFKIDPPSLLALTVKNDIPVRVEMTWKKEK